MYLPPSYPQDSMQLQRIGTQYIDYIHYITGCNVKQFEAKIRAVLQPPAGFFKVEQVEQVEQSACSMGEATRHTAEYRNHQQTTNKRRIQKDPKGAKTDHARVHHLACGVQGVGKAQFFTYQIYQRKQMNSDDSIPHGLLCETLAERCLKFWILLSSREL